MDDICNNSGSHFDGFSVCTGKIKMNFSQMSLFLKRETVLILIIRINLVFNYETIHVFIQE